MALVSINGMSNTDKISVTDRGLLFGESIYEVILVHNNKPFQLNQHLARLNDNFFALFQTSLDIPMIRQWISKYLDECKNDQITNIYIQLTPGSTPIRNHINVDIKPTCIITQTYAESVCIDKYRHGFRAITVEDTRSSLASIKTNNLALNTSALKQAHARHYHDAIFIKNGYFVEAASSNLFVVINDILITPPLEGILNGLTRQKVLAIAKNNHIPYEIRPIHADEISNASEVFLSSSVKLLKPLREVEGYFKQTQKFVIWESLFQAYVQSIEKECQYASTY
jgi:D-alanine transaminase